ncbi:MAG: hypothetical protein FWD69_16695 [Polyangiaceae bacterium]|nr:hypothetical protein [Polyangiaceae bacterium]
MSESPYEVVLLLASWIELVAVSVIVVRLDEKRLDEDALARAWPPSSRDNALIGLPFLGSPILGLFAVWLHFARTRRFSLKGMGYGTAWVIGILISNVLLTTALAWALDLPLD